MLNELRKGNVIPLIALLLIAFTIAPAAAIFPMKPTTMLSVHQTVAASRTQSPCQQQKNIQGQASKLCPSYNLQYYSLPAEFINSLPLLSDKATFLFILGLLAMSPVRRIFKPPRLVHIHNN
jgi:hypothetical protein